MQSHPFQRPIGLRFLSGSEMAFSLLALGTLLTALNPFLEVFLVLS
jgi:hypothetical protein